MKTAKIVAIVDHDSKLLFLRKQIKDQVANSEVEIKRLQEMANAYSKERQTDIDRVWRQIADHLQSKGLLPETYKFADDLRFSNDDQVIALVSANHKDENCDCPVCVLGRIFGMKQ